MMAMTTSSSIKVKARLSFMVILDSVIGGSFQIKLPARTISFLNENGHKMANPSLIPSPPPRPSPLGRGGIVASSTLVWMVHDSSHRQIAG
jgi:hypothetical protein